MKNRVLTGCLAAVLLGMVTFIGLFLFFSLSDRGRENAEKLTRITVIPAPTLTPTVYRTPEPIRLDIQYVSEAGLSVGKVIEIFGTENSGLSVRPDPGIGGALNFVANEGERFRITDGPDAKNDYVWWKIESLSDVSRTGWAVEDYMRPIELQ